MDTIVIAASKELMDAAAKALQLNPAWHGCIVWQDDGAGGNTVSYAEAEDGRVAMRNQVSGEDLEAMRAGLAEYLSNRPEIDPAAFAIISEHVEEQAVDGPDGEQTVSVLVPAQMPADWKSTES
jgi:hypothetical protein